MKIEVRWSGRPLRPTRPRAKLYTVTVNDSTAEVYTSCSSRFSHRCLLVSLPEVITATFAKRLKEARDLRGLSQRALGGLVDKDGDKNRGAIRVNRYEQQVNQADMTKAAELAQALDVPLAFLFAEDDDLAAAILAFAKLPAEQRARMRAELERLAGQQAP